MNACNNNIAVAEAIIGNDDCPGSAGSKCNTPDDPFSKTGLSISPLLEEFSPISLSAIDRVKLLNRMDQKFWFSVSKLPQILEQLPLYYRILSINEKRVQRYRTQYFDTENDLFYLQHHNGRANRVKVRKRQYLDSENNFIEIKKKSNTGKTRKIRNQASNRWALRPLDHIEQSFLEGHIEPHPATLNPCIQNGFNRITLVDLKLQERCTIDFGLFFNTENQTLSLDNLAIIELKQPGRRCQSKLGQILNEQNIKARSFSKYCIGRALMQRNLKQNRFKEAILNIRKIA